MIKGGTGGGNTTTGLRFEQLLNPPIAQDMKSGLTTKN